MIYLDSHVVVWLYAGDRSRLTPELLRRLEEDLLISPMVELELSFLHDTGRLRPTGAQIVSDLERRIGLAVCDLPFRDVVTASTEQRWTRDPFDRIIVGHAAAARRPLCSRDRRVRENYALAFWL